MVKRFKIHTYTCIRSFSRSRRVYTRLRRASSDTIRVSLKGTRRVNRGEGFQDSHGLSARTGFLGCSDDGHFNHYWYDLQETRVLI